MRDKYDDPSHHERTRLPWSYNRLTAITFCLFSLVNLPLHLMEEGRNCLFNDALNTFYLWLYGARHIVKDHSGSKRGNLLLPHGLLFPINSNGSCIFIIPQTG